MIGFRSLYTEDRRLRHRGSCPNALILLRDVLSLLPASARGERDQRGSRAS